MDEAVMQRELKDYVGEQLHEVAWRNAFPIHSGIGLDALLQGFKDTHFLVDADDARKSATFTFLFNDEAYATTLSYEELLRGWVDNKPPASIGALHNSVYLVHDRIGDAVRDSTKDPHPNYKWYELRHSHGRQVRDALERNLRPSFLKHHEHLFLPLARDDTVSPAPELGEPELINKIMAKFPFHLYARAHQRELEVDRVRCGPCAEYIDEYHEDDFDNDYMPSTDSWKQYLIGNYLARFSKLKGYPEYYGDETEKGRKRTFIVRGVEGFRNAEAMWRDSKHAAQSHS